MFKLESKVNLREEFLKIDPSIEINFVKDSDKLGTNEGNQVVTAETINGDHQDLAGGLQIRFGGESNSSTATSNNEWEVEVMGAAEHIDASGVKSVQNSRWLR